MKKFDFKAHNQKMMDISRRAAKGTYPSVKVARIGSSVGMAIGLGLILIGIVNHTSGNAWWLGSLLAGTSTVISNMYNLRRLRRL